MSAALILVAAGQGLRLGGGIPKAFRLVGGQPLFTYSLRTLLSLSEIQQCIVVVAPERRDSTRNTIDALGPWPLAIELVDGGAERQDSVANGLAAVRAPLVLIHDAARPFPSPDAARQCLAAAAEQIAAIVALPAHDTVKISYDSQHIDHTVDRRHVWLAQTPQGFQTERLREAIAEARRSGQIFTDEASMMEAAGVAVRLVVGSESNRKITTPGDLAWAEWYASARSADNQA